jgi:hypothetical protein
MVFVVQETIPVRRLTSIERRALAPRFFMLLSQYFAPTCFCQLQSKARGGELTERWGQKHGRA